MKGLCNKIGFPDHIIISRKRSGILMLLAGFARLVGLLLLFVIIDFPFSDYAWWYNVTQTHQPLTGSILACVVGFHSTSLRLPYCLHLTRADCLLDFRLELVAYTAIQEHKGAISLGFVYETLVLVAVSCRYVFTMYYDFCLSVTFSEMHWLNITV